VCFLIKIQTFEKIIVLAGINKSYIILIFKYNKFIFIGLMVLVNRIFKILTKLLLIKNNLFFNSFVVYLIGDFCQMWYSMYSIDIYCRTM